MFLWWGNSKTTLALRSGPSRSLHPLMEAVSHRSSSASQLERSGQPEGKTFCEEIPSHPQFTDRTPDSEAADKAQLALLYAKRPRAGQTAMYTIQRDFTPGMSRVDTTGSTTSQRCRPHEARTMPICS